MSAIRKIVLGAILLALSSVPALAQSNPNWGYGFVPTPGQWNLEWSSKQDYLGAAPCLVTGCVFTGPIVLAPSTATIAGLNIAPGVAPTSPNNGDTWVTSAGLFVRINGVTVGPLVGPGGGVLTAGSTATSGYSNTQILGSNGSVLSVYSVSGTGNVALTTSPVFTTPSLGVATGTSLALNGATLGGNTLAVNGFVSIGTGDLTVTGADSNFSAGGNRSFMDFASSNTRLGSLNGGGSAVGLQIYSNNAIVISVSTGGAMTISPAVTLSSALTYGGVTLNNAVTGTGNMVLSASPTLSGTVAGSFTMSGNITHSGQNIFTGTTAPTTAAGQTGIIGTIAGITVSGGNGQSYLFNTTGVGGAVTGLGSVYDAALVNSAGSIALGVTTATTNVVLLGNLTAASLTTSGTISGSICQDASGHIINKAGVNCFTAGAATSIAPGTTTISPTINGDVLYDNSGVLGEKTFASFLTAGQVVGTATNDNATAGNIGEIISANVAVGSAVALTSGTAANITSISLTAGDWDVSGLFVVNPAGTTTTSVIAASITTTSATLSALGGTGTGNTRTDSFNNGTSTTASSSGPNAVLGPTRMSLSGTTTVFLVGFSTFAVSTSAGYGYIRARRMR